jgi:hypothetical protein
MTGEKKPAVRKHQPASDGLAVQFGQPHITTRGPLVKSPADPRHKAAQT